MAIAKYFELFPLHLAGHEALCSAYERFWVFWLFWKKAFWGARRIGIGALA